LPVLAQAALSKVIFGDVMYRQDKDWIKRLQSPFQVAGPVNNRRYLDLDWPDVNNQVICCIGFFDATLPPLPRPLKNDAVFQFKDFSNARFIDRSRSIAKQIREVHLHHPLYPELCVASGRGRTAFMEANLARYENRAKPQSPPNLALPPRHPDAEPYVFGHLASSLGRIDDLLPPRFEIQDELTSIEIEDVDVHLRCRPTEFYVMADSLQSVMRFRVHYDANVYVTDLVEGLMKGIADAAVHYLVGEEIN